MSDYTVRLEQVFQGPMDLLLHLVREQEVEIHEIEIARVIEGYLEYLDALRELDIELAADFLLTAATLMSIKARSLLPREEVDLAAELDPKDELIQRLLEYRRFKEASERLYWSQIEREQIARRGAFPELEEVREEPTLDLGELTPWDLLGAFSRLLRETLANRPHHVYGDRRPMRFYVAELAHRVRAAGRLSLRELLVGLDEAPSRDTLVGAFCALLELVRMGIVSATQEVPRGEIELAFEPDVEGDLDHLLEGARFEDERPAEPAAENGDPGPPDERGEPAQDGEDDPAEAAGHRAAPERALPADD